MTTPLQDQLVRLQRVARLAQSLCHDMDVRFSCGTTIAYDDPTLCDLRRALSALQPHDTKDATHE